MRTFTMQKTCPACRCRFTITSAASVFCQHRDCHNKRRRDDRAARKAALRAAIPVGSDAFLERAVKSGA